MCTILVNTAPRGCSVRGVNPVLFWFRFMTGFLSLNDDLVRDAYIRGFDCWPLE